MRIISGQFKGRRLNPSKLKFTRPTTDFAREGLFNILNNLLDIERIEVLDLYSGSGAISIEFLSRGAKHVTALDQDSNSVRFIAGIKKEWGIPNLEIIKNDALKYIERCNTQFDLIFADPPYTLDHHSHIVNAVLKKELLKTGGMLIVEHDDTKNFTDLEGFMNKRTFGKVNFSIFSSQNPK